MGWKDNVQVNINGRSMAFGGGSVDAPLAAELSSLLEEGAVRDGSRDFASSLLRGFAKYKSFTDKQRPYVEKIIAEAKAPRVAYAPPAEKMLAVKLPAGYYAVESRRFRVDVVESGKWEGWTFVKDGSMYAGENGSMARRIASSKPGSALVLGKNPTRFDKSDIEAIAANPLAAAIQYGRITGRCGICNRVLENPESVAAGIGPICAGRFA